MLLKQESAITKILNNPSVLKALQKLNSAPQNIYSDGKYHHKIRPYATLSVHGLAHYMRYNYALGMYKITYLGKKLLQKKLLFNSKKSLIAIIIMSILSVIPYILACVINNPDPIISDFILSCLLLLDIKLCITSVIRVNKYRKVRQSDSLWLFCIAPLPAILFIFFSAFTILTSF